MGITSTYDANAGQVTIQIDGRFDYTTNKAFREAYQDHEPGVQYEIDASKMEFMDSSALGMLLLLREHVGDPERKVRIVNCQDSVRETLKLANFDRLFEIT